MLLAFDLDGTLIACRDRQVAVAAALAREAGVGNFRPDRFWALKRRGRTTREALEDLGTAQAESLAGRWVDMVEADRWLRLDGLVPGAVRCLEALRAAGHEAVLVTARRRADAVRAQVDALGLGRLLADIRVVPPTTAVAAKASALADSGAGGYVGDAETDAAAADAAGVPFAAVGYGQRDPDYLRARGIEPVHGELTAAVDALLAV